jgi:hypothetical protein
MTTLLLQLLRLLPVLCGGRRHLALENLALRRQLAVYKKALSRPKLHRSDRLFWACLSGCGEGGDKPSSSWRRHRAPLAAAPFPRVLGQALREAPGGPPIAIGRNSGEGYGALVDVYSEANAGTACG